MYVELSRATRGKVLPLPPLLAGAIGRAWGPGWAASFGAPLHGPLLWEIRRVPASCLTQRVLRGGHSLLAATHGGFLRGASNQPEELCILVMYVTMGLSCCSKDSPSGKPERTRPLQNHLSSILHQGI